jgi:chorismate mutase/prephenate dehydratase
MSSLADLRIQIDSIDDQIVALLDKRADLAMTIGERKRAAIAADGILHDPERERAVISRLEALTGGPFPRGAVGAVFREIMSACLSLEEPLNVAYLGPDGTFTQMAARRLFGLAARYFETATIEGVFDAVAAGDAALGVVPIENSTEGSVTETADALLEGNLLIRAEYVLPVEHALLARAKIPLSAIARVYSKPQALAQCRQWLGKNLPNAQLVQTSSTAGAWRDAMADSAGAAIANAVVAEIHGLTLLREKIQDREENATRFVVVGKEDAPRTGTDRTSVAFSIQHERGALRRALSTFEDAGINLSRIESRPSQAKAWDYVFVVDLDGHRKDDVVKAALEELSKQCAMIKVLGSYARR